LTLGYIKRWEVTLNTSMYFENTVDVFSHVRYESGGVDPDLDAAGAIPRTGTPVILSTPINIGKSKDLDLNFL
jgi:hypothetical protein